MNCQMILVISSPSSSTTGFFTLIFAMRRSLVSWARGRLVGEPRPGGALAVAVGPERLEARDVRALHLHDRVDHETPLLVADPEADERRVVGAVQRLEVRARG